MSYWVDCGPTKWGLFREAVCDFRQLSCNLSLPPGMESSTCLASISVTMRLMVFLWLLVIITQRVATPTVPKILIFSLRSMLTPRRLRARRNSGCGSVPPRSFSYTSHGSDQPSSRLSTRWCLQFSAARAGPIDSLLPGF